MNEMNDPMPPKFDYVRFGRRLFSKRWRLMLIIFLVIAVPTVTWVMMFMERMYESSATIFIDPGKDEPTFMRGLMNTEMSGLYLAILRSRSLAQGVVDSLPREARDELISSALGELVECASEAVATLRALLSASDERVRLGAAKSTLDQLLRLRETLMLSQRLAALERSLQAQTRRRR